MSKIEVKIQDEYIKLDQLLKFSGAIDSGGQAKLMILNGDVFVNGEVAMERGKKIRPGDIVKVDDIEIEVI